MELKELLEKVGALYMKFGIKSVTMDDIAHQLGISKKTLYLFIEDKADLVTKVVYNQLERERSKFQSIEDNNNNAIEELINVNRHLRKMLSTINPSTEYDLKKYYPELHSKVKEHKLHNMYNSVLRNMKNGIEEGLYRKELNAEFIAKYYVSRIESNMDFDFFRREVKHIHDFIYEIFVYHIRGISSPEGIKFLEKHIDEIKSDSYA